MKQRHGAGGPLAAEGGSAPKERDRAGGPLAAEGGSAPKERDRAGGPLAAEGGSALGGPLAAEGGSALKEKKRKGLVIVFTGDGKGKTTAAMGMALRASGNRMRVRVIQFIKGAWKTGEVDAVKPLAPMFEIVRAGLGFTIDRLRDPRIDPSEHTAAAQAGLEEARTAITSGDFAVVVLDEILGAIKAELVTCEQVLGLIAAKPPMLHLVLTGRDAPPEIVEAADLVTEMRLIKHPYKAGIIAQRGVEF